MTFDSKFRVASWPPKVTVAEHEVMRTHLLDQRPKKTSFGLRRHELEQHEDQYLYALRVDQVEFELPALSSVVRPRAGM